jgi:hypothetical protein
MTRAASELVPGCAAGSAARCSAPIRPRAVPVACPTNANAKPPAYATRSACRLLRKPSSQPSPPSRQVPNGRAPRPELHSES